MKALFNIASVLLAHWNLLNACALAADGRVEQEAFIHWSAAPVERLADGRVKAVLTLESSGILEKPAAYYRLARLGRFNGPEAPLDPEFYGLDWEADGRRVVILSGEYSRVTVFARAEFQGRPLYAQTAFNLYGRSKAGAAHEANLLALAPDWPEFLLGSDGPLYWPQTGQIFNFQLKGVLDAEATKLAVWDGGRRVAELAPGAAGFQYQPEPDPALDRAGDAASKPLVFVLPLGDGGLASFTLLVHRSRQTGRDLPAGLGIFAAAILVSGAVVGLARRRFRLCA
jgi:hypothetical protein